MTTLTLRRASGRTSKAASTIRRAIAKNKIQATKDADGIYQIDSKSLFRVFPETSRNPAHVANRPTLQPSKEPADAILAKLEIIETHLNGLNEMTAEIKATCAEIQTGQPQANPPDIDHELDDHEDVGEAIDNKIIELFTRASKLCTAWKTRAIDAFQRLRTSRLFPSRSTLDAQDESDRP